MPAAAPSRVASAFQTRRGVGEGQAARVARRRTFEGRRSCCSWTPMRSTRGDATRALAPRTPRAARPPRSCIGPALALARDGPTPPKCANARVRSSGPSGVRTPRSRLNRSLSFGETYPRFGIAARLGVRPDALDTRTHASRRVESLNSTAQLRITPRNLTQNGVWRESCRDRPPDRSELRTLERRSKKALSAPHAAFEARAGRTSSSLRVVRNVAVA